MSFINPDFLLHTKTARRLYKEYAEAEPILDYHCHLPPKEIAENRQFQNLAEIWLEGDHYKWRAMRANGIAEKYCTGDGDPKEKFLAWARTVPYTLRNPLYHWTHLELLRYFDIDLTLNESTAEQIWDLASAKLKSGSLNTQQILKKFDVRALCTTDDPTDDLGYHKAIAASGIGTKVYPTFRPDKALTVHQPKIFKDWVKQLAVVSKTKITKLSDFLDALEKRHNFFHSMGGRLSDHGLNHAFSEECTDTQASRIFMAALKGKAANPQQHAMFASFMMYFFGRLDAKKGWTKQLHLGARRNGNTRAFQKIGTDVGFDGIGDWPQIDSLANYMNHLESESNLPKMVLYNLNPADDYAFATLIGTFQDGSIAGKIQFGSGWWFLDQKEAMEWQINALSNCGLLSRFIGMLTDSRSFLSYPRHEYFRRVLCNLLGQEMELGELPNDLNLVGGMVRRICFANVRDHLGLAL